LQECLALGDETQKNWRYSAGAYQTGETHGRPLASAVPSVMYRLESMIALAVAPSSGSRVTLLPFSVWT
jgi:hypothetical protein